MTKEEAEKASLEEIQKLRAANDEEGGVLTVGDRTGPTSIQAAIVICCTGGNFLKESTLSKELWDSDVREALVFDDEWQAREFMKEHGQTGWQILANPCTAIEAVLYEHE